MGLVLCYPLMFIFRPISWFIAALLVTAGSLIPLSVHAETYVEAGKTHSWLSLSRPTQKNPAAQLAHAEQLMDQQHYRKAGRAFRALVMTWPGSVEAPLAQWYYARTFDKRGKLQAAFDEYQVLMDNYSGRFANYDEVLTRQFEIAKTVMNTRRGRMLFLPGFEAPERAIPLFEKIIQNGPRSPFAPEAQFLIGEAYEKSFQYELAVVAYIATLHRYPLSPFAEHAAFGRARSLYAISRDYPNDQQAIDEAWAGIMVFLRSFPGSDYAPEAITMRDGLLVRKSEAVFKIADYYDRIAKRPEAARESYADFLRQFPESALSDKARERMIELAGKTESSKDESNE